MISIGKDGELYADPGGHFSLRDIAVKKGRYVAYRELQARMLAHYFDLTHTLEEVETAQEGVQEAIQTRPFSQTLDPLQSIERLVIPRTSLSKEKTPTQSDAEDIGQPKVRRHGVTWHRRRLPDGWHASPEALKRAAELGIELADNETVVKRYRRGSRLLGEVVAHRLVESS